MNSAFREGMTIYGPVKLHTDPVPVIRPISNLACPVAFSKPAPTPDDPNRRLVEVTFWGNYWSPNPQLGPIFVQGVSPSYDPTQVEVWTEGP